ncbi:MAG: hypothetical protein ACK56F_25700, partial [bacterium]
MALSKAIRSILQEGGERNRRTQFAVVAHGLFKIDTLLFVFKLKFHRHGTEGTGFGVLRVAVIFVWLGGLAEEGHVAGAAQCVAGAADSLGHV